MTLLHQRVEPTFASAPDVEALIQEARRLRRRRRLLGIAVTVLLVGTAVGLGVGLSAGKPDTRPKRNAAGPGASSSPLATTSVSPKAPGALAVSSRGELYVVDSGRDQILGQTKDGKFKVIAGTGKRGFSGDGGLAVDAKLNLTPYGVSSGIAVAPDGTVYFSDSGNDRVRAVLPDGRIETVAGGGTLPLPTNAGEEVAARSASLGPPVGLAFGPDGDLYIAANFIVRLTTRGQLVWVAGSTNSAGSICTTTGCPVREFSFHGGGDIAFDGDGDMVASTGYIPDGYDLVELRANGERVYIRANARGEGGKSVALASGPHGSIVWAAQTGLYRLADGSESPTLISGASAALTGQLGPAVSSYVGGPRALPPFLGGNGIAVGAHGEMYVDTAPNATVTPFAILELSPTDSARALWKS